MKLAEKKPCPVKEGQVCDVVIESIGTKGDGIARIEGFVIIIPGTTKGEKLKIKIIAIRGKQAFAEISNE